MTPPPSAILLVASNRRLTVRRATAALRLRVGGAVEIAAACGFGRPYGTRTEAVF